MYLYILLNGLCNSQLLSYAIVIELHKYDNMKNNLYLKNLVGVMNRNLVAVVFFTGIMIFASVGTIGTVISEHIKLPSSSTSNGSSSTTSSTNSTSSSNSGDNHTGHHHENDDD